MRIVVCVKQVPDAAEVHIDPERGTLIREGVAAMLNPLDVFAIEAGVALAEAHGGTALAVSMGPPAAGAVLREAVARGCERGVLLSDRAFAGADTWATSLVLAAAVRELGGVDLVLCGRQAIDGDTAQVGPGIAAHLDWPQAVGAAGMELDAGGRRLRVETRTDHGDEILDLPLPAVVTVLKEACVPRLPSLPRAMAGRRHLPETWDAARLGEAPTRCGLDGSPTRVVEIAAPPGRGACRMVSGGPAAAAAELVALLRAGKAL